jgi:hypothetical protein
LIRVIGVIRGGFFFYRELREAREFPEERDAVERPDLGNRYAVFSRAWKG